MCLCVCACVRACVRANQSRRYVCERIHAHVFRQLKYKLTDEKTRVLQESIDSASVARDMHEAVL